MTNSAISSSLSGSKDHQVLTRMIQIASVLIILIGTMVLVGWSLDLDVLKRVAPDFVTMKVNTALLFIAMALVLLLHQSASISQSRKARWLSLLLLSLVLLVSALTLVEYTLSINLGIDEALFRDNEHRGSLTYPPGRLSPVTGINFILISVSILLHDVKARASQGLAIAVFFISLLGFVSYIYRLKSLYGPWSPLSLAFHTTVGFLLLSTAALASHRGRGLAKLLTDVPGARSNRWLFLGALTLPTGLGQLVLLGYAKNDYSGDFGLALFTVMLTLSFVTLFWVTAEGRSKTEEALARSEQQFRTLANAIPHLAWMADDAGSLFWYNRRWFDYTGTTQEEMKGWGWQKVHDPQILPEVLLRWQNAIATGQSFEMTFPLRSSTGEFRMFLTRGEPLKNDRQQVVRWFGTNTDITAQIKIEEELRRINSELEEFAYVASHDLQEPLRMVNIYTQRLVSLLDRDDSNMRQYAGFIENGVLRMQSLIRDLLMYSRTIHCERLPVGTADLPNAFSEALAQLKDRIDERQAVVLADPLPIVQGDTSQLASVFQNLLSNALKYSKEEISPVIHVSSRSEGERWVISVQDNGIGFESQYSERIFGLFKRLHREEYPGTGIGLAICKRIVERYGGRIWAEGKEGNGAVFSFSLPSVQSEADVKDPSCRR